MFYADHDPKAGKVVVKEAAAVKVRFLAHKTIAWIFILKVHKIKFHIFSSKFSEILKKNL